MSKVISMARIETLLDLVTGTLHEVGDLLMDIDDEDRIYQEHESPSDPLDEPYCEPHCDCACKSDPSPPSRPIADLCDYVPHPVHGEPLTVDETVETLGFVGREARLAAISHLYNLIDAGTPEEAFEASKTILTSIY